MKVQTAVLSTVRLSSRNCSTKLHKMNVGRPFFYFLDTHVVKQHFRKLQFFIGCQFCFPFYRRSKKSRLFWHVKCGLKGGHTQDVFDMFLSNVKLRAMRQKDVSYEKHLCCRLSLTAELLCVLVYSAND